MSAEAEARFKFELVIYKDSDTHIESMKITNYVVDKQMVAAGAWETTPGNENGSIITSIVDLPQDIKKFKRFGIPESVKLIFKMLLYCLHRNAFGCFNSFTQWVKSRKPAVRCNTRL